MRLDDCYNFEDFRRLAKKNLPAPIFHYIDGGSDDETTLKRNTESFLKCDLVPNILASVGEPDLSTTVFGQKIDMPLFLAPTAMQRLYHHDGDKASARAAEKFGTFYSMSTMATSSIEEIANVASGPKMFQLYIHKDQGLTDNLIDRCKTAGFKSLCLTVDTVVAGNRERDHKWGFTTPPKLTLKSIMSFATHPKWAFNYLTHKKFELANVSHWTKKGSSIAKGVMSVEDAKRALEIGASAIMLSNHGGRQLDGSRSPFDQLPAIADAGGGKLEIILDGGVRRGTHVLKALSLGATACSFGKGFLFALGAGGQKGVEQILKRMRDEIRRDMILLGCKSIKELNKTKIVYR